MLKTMLFTESSYGLIPLKNLNIVGKELEATFCEKLGSLGPTVKMK